MRAFPSKGLSSAVAMLLAGATLGLMPASARAQDECAHGGPPCLAMRMPTSSRGSQLTPNGFVRELHQESGPSQEQNGSTPTAADAPLKEEAIAAPVAKPLTTPSWKVP